MYNNSSRSDTKAKPLIFDEQFNPKLGFYGVLKAQLEAVFAN
jgi:hypothetical protein